MWTLTLLLACTRAPAPDDIDTEVLDPDSDITEDSDPGPAEDSDILAPSNTDLPPDSDLPPDTAVTDTATPHDTGTPDVCPPWPTHFPPVGYDIGVFYNYGCSIDPGHGLRCWGGNLEPLAGLDSGEAEIHEDWVTNHPWGEPALAMAVGELPFLLRPDHTVITWPDRDGYHEAVAPDMSAGVAEMGNNHGTYYSAILLDGSLVRQYPPPALRSAGPYTYVTGCSAFVCAVRAADGGMDCWSYHPDDERMMEATVPMDESWLMFDAIPWSGCGVRTSTELFCDHFPYWHLETERPTTTGWALVAQDSCAACALHASDGHIECWGEPTCMADLGAPPADAGYVDLEVFDKTACAIKLNGDVTCWGDNEWGERDVPF
jgi:hypothetical protein